VKTFKAFFVALFYADMMFYDSLM